MYNEITQESIKKHFNDIRADIDIAEYEYYKHLTERTIKALEHSQFLEERASKLYGCGTYLGFHVDGESHALAEANFCKQRLCPMCQKRRSLKVFSDQMKIQKYLGTQYVYLHMILTLQNVVSDELSDTIDKLFVKSSLFLRDKRLKRAFHGALRCFEVTYSAKRDDYHPHLHCLIAVKPSYFTSRDYIKQTELSDLWSGYIGQKTKVFVKKCTDNRALAEVAKYAVKPLELDLPPEKHLEVLETLFTALHGRRLLQTYGVIRAAARTLRIDVNADAENPKEEANTFYYYNHALSQYEKRA